ncbi:hypothetical protein [Rhizobium sp. AAP116]|uniref:hypothetical protein n=1 Tax=Rhizobium sp. AAP116 TaxID=1523429 RepID=UPI0006B9120B|nr:hypothetical protein [Rhizobium sp. AAP116]KPF57182.1 hypothetical protein IP85_14455 [Rhizobium sp. AAP116]
MTDFAAYIVSFRPADPTDRSLRLTNLMRQITWWQAKTSVPINLFASGWTEAEFERHPVMRDFGKGAGKIIFLPSQSLVMNRHACLSAFYESSFSWGVMMDDDAILYDTDHNCGPHLFDEMSRNGVHAYDGVDVFFPIDPRKQPFTRRWEADPDLYGKHHVFNRDLDLKGSMFVVRNFQKEGRAPVYPDPNFALHGEDTLFALTCVAQGYTVMRCWNIVLKELPGPSFFGDNRIAAMKAGNEELARRFAHLGLNMRPDSHLLDRRDFQESLWREKPKKAVVRKSA